MTRRSFVDGDREEDPQAGTEQDGRPGARRLAVLRAWLPVFLTGLAVVLVLVIGLLMGRALTSPNWTQVVPMVVLPALVLVLFLRPQAGIIAWIVLAPFAAHLYLKLDMGSGIPNLDVTRLTALVLLFQIVSGVILHSGRRRRVTWTDMAMLVFIGAMLLSLLGSQLGISSGIQTIFDFVAIPLFAYWFARHWCRSRSDVGWAVSGVAVVVTLLGIITVREQLTGLAVFSPVHYSLVYEGRIRKVLSVFGSPAAMTTALSVSIPSLLLGIRQATDGRRRIALGLALIAVLAGVFFAYVRAGWLGAVIGVIVLLWLSPAVRRALTPLLPVMVVVVMILVAVTVINPQTVGGRLTSDEPITYRLTAWRIAWDIFLRSPVIGVGYGQFGIVASRDFGWNPFVRLEDMPSPHNSYLDILVQGGLLAVLPYVAMFVGLAWQGLRFWRQAGAGERGVERRELVATLWATVAGYVLTIGTFDVLNSQYANILLFVIAGTLIGRLEGQSGAAG